MSGEDRRFIGENQQPVVNGFYYLFERSAPKISSANALLEQRVAAEDLRLRTSKVERKAAWGMPRRVQNFQYVGTEAESVALFQELIHIHHTRWE